MTSSSGSSSSSSSSSSNYVEDHLPPAIIKKLESGAFQSLCTHLQERSDQVPNLDLMTVSGFCRNCLAKVSKRYCVPVLYLVFLVNAEEYTPHFFFSAVFTSFFPLLKIIKINTCSCCTFYLSYYLKSGLW